MSTPDNTKFTRKHWCIVIITVATLWSLSNGYEAYLNYSLETYRIDTRVSLLEKQNEILEQLNRTVDQAEADERAKNAI